MKTYYLYIMANQPRGTIYIGLTNNLERRYGEHRNGLAPGFAKKYKLHRLIYYEESDDIEAIIQREKQLKSWHRQWKINLIEKENPLWADLGKRFRMDAETSSA